MDRSPPPHLLEALRRRVRLFQSSPLRKVASHPWRMLYSAAIAKLRSRSGRVQRKQVETFWGDRMTIALPELFSMSLYRYGFVEDAVSGFFLHYVKPGMIVFDIGAHFGFFTLLASQ